MHLCIWSSFPWSKSKNLNPISTLLTLPITFSLILLSKIAINQNCRKTSCFTCTYEQDRMKYNHIITITALMHSVDLALTFSDVSTGVFNGGIAIHIWQQTKAESITSARVSVSINNNARCRCMEHFTDAVIKLIICHRTPILRLLVAHRFYNDK